MSISAESAVSALIHSTHWPGLLRVEAGLEASYSEQERVWRLSQGDSLAEVEAASGRVLRGSWAVKPGQAILQLVVSTTMACLGIYSLAYAAKTPCLMAAVNLAALFKGAFGGVVTAGLALLFLGLWGAYLLDYVTKNLMSALEVVHSGRQQLPDVAPWREPLRMLAVAQSIYIFDSLLGAMERHQLTGPFLFGLAMQVVLILGCSKLAASAGRNPIWDALGWTALWLACVLVPWLGFFCLLPVTLFVTTRRMLAELSNGVIWNVHAETLTEKLFWLSLSLMLFVSFGALIGHAGFWATLAMHPAYSVDDYAKQCWVWGATIGTILALFMAPLGPVKVPLFIASTLYQALLGRFGALPALLGAVAVIFLAALREHPREPRRAFGNALTFGLAESAGRVLGACLGLFFLGLEGGAVGGALGERILGALVLLKSEESL